MKLYIKNYRENTDQQDHLHVNSELLESLNKKSPIASSCSNKTHLFNIIRLIEQGYDVKLPVKYLCNVKSNTKEHFLKESTQEY